MKQNRLDPEQYRDLWLEVLRRDGWKCQSCGARHRLQVHHQLFRSHCGEDRKENLIALCAVCHEQAHAVRLQIVRTVKKNALSEAFFR